MQSTRLMFIAAVALLCVAAPTAEGQRHRARAPSVAEARAAFPEVRDAWVALLALDVEAADASGVLRAWDRRWARRLEAIDRAQRAACVLRARTCREAEVDALACNVALNVLNVRRTLLTPYGGAHRDRDADGTQIEPMADRLALADEAARRGRAGLSCEDLPYIFRLRRDACGRWFDDEGHALVAGDPDSEHARSDCGSAGAEDHASRSEGDPAAHERMAPAATSEPARAGAHVPVARVGRLSAATQESAGLDACWTAASSATPGAFPRRVDVAATIRASGAVTAVEALGATPETLALCIEHRVARLRWPPTSEARRVIFAIEFNGARPADPAPSVDSAADAGPSGDTATDAGMSGDAVPPS